MVRIFEVIDGNRLMMKILGSRGVKDDEVDEDIPEDEDLYKAVASARRATIAKKTPSGAAQAGICSSCYPSKTF